MFENENYEDIVNRMLDRAPETMDTRESSFLYNAVAPVAVELQNMYIALDNIRNITFFDTADREGKYQRCKERGIDTKQFDATCSIVIIHTTPENLELPIKVRFNYQDLNFEITEKISDGKYYAQCETLGTIGNITGIVVPIDYIDGLMTSEITEIYRYGEDEADEAAIDEVYYASLNSQAFGGNRADYIQKLKKLAGVGGVKVYTAAEWKGGGTVKLVFTTSANTKPSESFVDSIQTLIDPLQNQGEGYGIAPIGHTVTVAGVDETLVNIRTNIVLQTGYEWKDIEGYIEAAVESYFNSLNSKWDSQDNIIVRISQLETYILGVTGVIDVSDTYLNGNNSNLTIDRDSIVVRGRIDATT